MLSELLKVKLYLHYENMQLFYQHFIVVGVFSGNVSNELNYPKLDFKILRNDPLHSSNMLWSCWNRRDDSNM